MTANPRSQEPHSSHRLAAAAVQLTDLFVIVAVHGSAKQNVVLDCPVDDPGLVMGEPIAYSYQYVIHDDYALM